MAAIEKSEELRVFEDSGKLTDKRKEAISKELGDCCWYLSNLCSDADCDLQVCYEMKSSSQTQRVRMMEWPQLVLHMNRCASLLSEALESWYYDYACRLGERSRFIAISHNVTKIFVCIEELAIRCDCTLEDIYVGNIEKLLSRKERGKIKGDGDNR